MMIYREDNLIGYDDTHTEQFFSGSDHIREYENNLKKQPNDWIYKKKKFSYKRNAHGHRTPKDVKDLRKDFFLFTGCSHTEGIGIAHDETYAHIVSDSFNIDYYNIALGGTGADVMYHNLVHWFKNNYPKPKLVFLQWPDPTRYSCIDDTNNRIIDAIYKNNKFKSEIGRAHV